tara:strand:+ start:16615 stop:17895 length:1281 start_codon:yes stop_codon:yes gene_type:complete
MAADSTLVEGAYRASKHYDMGLVEANRRLADEIKGGIGKIKPLGNREKKKKQDNNVNVPTGDNTVSSDQYQGITDNEVQLNKDANNNALAQTPDELLSPEDQEKKEVVISEENADQISKDVEENPISSQDTNNTNNNLLNLKQQYYDAVKSGDNNLAEQILNSVDTTADEIEGWKQEISSTASNWTNRSKAGGINTPRGFGMSLEKDPVTKKWFSDFIGSGEKMQMIDTGAGLQAGVIGPDGEFMTKNQYQKLKERYEVDNESMNALHELSQGFYDMGSQGGPEDTWNTNMAMNVQTQVRDIVDASLEKGDSIKYDSNFGGTSFFDDLVERDQLKGMPYSHLGIDPAAFDRDGDGKLSAEDGLTEEDRKSIYEAAMKSPVLKDDMRQLLINYFTEHVKRNYNASHNIIASRHSMPEDLSSAEVVEL